MSVRKGKTSAYCAPRFVVMATNRGKCSVLGMWTYGI
uniref:Uncharacterized protein n=1 Tax=Anguilla anguilla TaxID=7936 RepID=A0A0E9V416_ANGAN